MDNHSPRSSATPSRPARKPDWAGPPGTEWDRTCKACGCIVATTVRVSHENGGLLKVIPGPAWGREVLGAGIFCREHLAEAQAAVDAGREARPRSGLVLDHLLFPHEIGWPWYSPGVGWGSQTAEGRSRE
jgi:hypothetical protein